MTLHLCITTSINIISDEHWLGHEGASSVADTELHIHKIVFNRYISIRLYSIEVLSNVINFGQ